MQICIQVFCNPHIGEWWPLFVVYLGKTLDNQRYEIHTTNICCYIQVLCTKDPNNWFIVPLFLLKHFACRGCISSVHKTIHNAIHSKHT